MSNKSKYNPIPTRVWSRVQSTCTYTTTDEYKYSVYVPLLNKTMSQAAANYETQILTKGNILQYKKNSANLTKNQRYSQLSKGISGSRKKSYATQTVTYTNPNTNSLLRVNSDTIFPNTLVGYPNNISGPYQYGVMNPFGCSTDSIESGGNLICNTTVQPCTNEIIQETKSQNCYPITASNVPGFSNPFITKELCWNPRIQPWYPKQRRIMNNSLDKWPVNYKAFVSACSK